jgi:hypothetical protein
MVKRSPKMTAAKRKRLASKTFAIPGKRKYPIDTKGRAINALSRVSQRGTPAEKRQVRANVGKKYPSLKRGK